MRIIGYQGRNARARFYGVFLGVSLACGPARAQVDFFDLPPISYSDTDPTDPMAQLWAREGLVETLEGFREGKEALRYLLKELEVPEESQVLVFSKTSLQTKLINPETPRAVYFSKDTYVGWVPGGMVEIITTDPELGPVFYAVRLPGGEGPVGVERALSCLQCHATGRTEGVPGVFVRSVVPDEDGFPLLFAGTSLTTHASPIPERWGGWYVTGTSDEPHLGNRTTTEAEALKVGFPARPGDSAGRLTERVDMTRYLQPTSDVVALMVLEHQCRMHNLLTKAALNYRRAWYLQQALDADADRLDEEGISWKSARSGAEEILAELLFCEEAEMGGDGVEGTEAFQEIFEAGAPMSREGRTLREFRLYQRIFQYRCSYMIYSAAFEHLPPVVKNRVFARLREVLLSEEEEEKFSHLKSSERTRIADILRDTLPGLPEGW